jgi:hypothetical protein
MTRQPRRFFWCLNLWLVALALLLPLAGHAGVVQFSNTFLNLSQDADPQNGSMNVDPKVVTAGDKVYVLWSAASRSSSRYVIWLRRSVDGGATWLAPQELAEGGYYNTWQPLAAEGDNVYIAFGQGWVPSRLLLLRSGDAGQTFQAPSVLHEGNAYNFNGVHVTAANQGKVAVLFATMREDSPRQRHVSSSSSTDAGRTFVRTDLINVDTGSASWLYKYSVVDAVRSGDNVYVLTISQVENWTTTQSYLDLWASSDGGRTFRTPARVTVRASDGKSYAPGVQDAGYTPHLAANGAEVSVVWINNDNPGGFDGGWAPSLRINRSTDAGVTLGTPVTLHTYPSGYSHGARPGLETITRAGNTLHISSTRSGSGTFYWRSTDAGATWPTTATQISTGGWWQHIGIDPRDAQRVHVFNGSWFRSLDGGASFDGGVTVVNNFGAGWASPHLAMTASGVPQYAGYINLWDNRHVYARALAPAQVAGSTNKALQLVTSGDFRRDQFWVAARPAMEFSTAMTVEYWIKLVDGNPNYVLQTFLGKKRRSGENSWELAGWNGDQVFSRLVTTGSGSSNYGDWLGAGGSSLPKNTWAHLAMTYNASAGADNWKLYVNGVLKAKSNLTGTIVSELMDSSLRVGNQGNTASTVLVDELRLWNKARTASEIKSYMALALNGNENGLVGYWNFNDTLRDSSPSGNEAVPQFMETFVADAPALTGKAPALTACATLLTTDLTLNIPCIKFQSAAGTSYVQATLSADSRLGALGFGLVDAFAITTPTSDTGCVAQLDANLNLVIPCVQYADQAWWLKLKFVTSGANFGFGVVDLGQGTPP